MIPLYQDRCFTFRFADDRRIARFHLEGLLPGTQAAVHAADPDTLQPLRLLMNVAIGEAGWVELDEPIIVRAGEAFVVIPKQHGTG